MREIKNIEDIDHEYTQEVVCPWCGHEYADSWEFPNDDDDEHCNECGNIFSFERIVSVEYVSKRIEREEQ